MSNIGDMLVDVKGLKSVHDSIKNTFSTKQELTNVDSKFSEVNSARQSGNGTTYNNLKARLDADKEAIETDIGELKADLDDNVNDLKSAITPYNPYNIIDFLFSASNDTRNGATYTWSGHTCTVTGTTTSSISTNNIINYKQNLPSNIIPGNNYEIRYTTDNTNIQLGFVFWNSSDTASYLYLSNGISRIIIPSDAEKWVIRLYIESGKNPTGTVTQIALLTQVDDSDKQFLEAYNTYPISTEFFNKKSASHNGITYTWGTDGKCTVTGTSSSTSANSFYNNTTGFPVGIEVGKSYYLNYVTSDSNVRFMVTYYKSGGTAAYYCPYTSDTVFTVPSDVIGIAFGLNVQSGKSFATPAIISRVAILDLDSIYYKSSNAALQAKGRLANNTDLDTVKGENAFYLLTAYGTYTNIPETSINGFLLKIFNPYPTVTVQEIINLARTGNTFVRYYTQSNDTWHDWSNRSGSVTNYNNAYTTENYENTYNITCSPTITTDTNNYLASTGDDTDRTGDIQTMLNTTGVCHLGAGKFVVTGVSVPDYAALIGSGDRTTIVLADSVTSGYAVKLNNYSSIFGLRIRGGSTAQGTSDSVGTRHGILFEGTKRSGQSDGVTKKRSKIDKCTINNFAGGGITLTGTGLDVDSNLLISDCFVDHCGAGLYIPYYSEFHRICNCSFSYNYYGCVDNGGNNNFANCDFSGNKIGLLIDNSTNQSPNVAHGSFTNCSVNHSYSDGGVINEGTAIKLLKANLGEIFTGMQIFYGAIIIDDCVGIRFIGANVGSKVPITITDSTVVTFSDCTFKDAPDHADSTFTQSGNTVLKFRDCYLRNGTAYDPMN